MSAFLYCDDISPLKFSIRSFHGFSDYMTLYFMAIPGRVAPGEKPNTGRIEYGFEKSIIPSLARDALTNRQNWDLSGEGTD